MRPLAILLTISLGVAGGAGAACTRNCNIGCAYSSVLNISVPPDRLADVIAIEAVGSCTVETGPCAPDAGASPWTCSTGGISVRSTGSGSCSVTVRLRYSPAFVVTPTLRHFEQTCGCNGDLFIGGELAIPSSTDGGANERE